MCDPVSIGIGTAAVGAGIGASQGGVKGALIGGVVGAGVGYGGATLLGVGAAPAATSAVPSLTPAGLSQIGGTGFIGSGSALSAGAGAGAGSGVGTGVGAAASGSGGGLFTARNIFTGLSLVGTGINAFGTFNKSRAVAGAAEFRSGVADNNALIAEQNAILTLERGVADVEDKQLEIGKKIGFQKAKLASMGFFPDEGSSVDMLVDIAVLGELDILRITADAKNRERNFRQQAGDFRTEAQLGRLASRNIKKAGDIDMVGTLLGGAANAGTTFLATKTV
tara:strand:+ start:596 stop:1435 length:840 start_codon:yes stop_codon:yes gene_type:complete